MNDVSGLIHLNRLHLKLNLIQDQLFQNVYMFYKSNKLYIKNCLNDKPIITRQLFIRKAN